MAQQIFVKPNLDGSYTAYTEGPNGSSSTTAPYRRVSKKSRLNNPDFSSSSVFDLTGVEENEARRLFEAEERKLGLNQKEPKLKKTKILEKNFWSFKILLKIILKMSVTTLLIKLGLYTLIEKKLKVYMETQRKTRLKNYMMKVLKLTLSLG